MHNNLDHLTADDETENKEAADIAHAYADGFFDNMDNVVEVANHLKKDKELYKEELDEFFNADVNPLHREWFESHLPTSALVIRNLKANCYSLQIGKRMINIDHTNSSIHFIRGLIQLVEKTHKNSSITIETLVQGSSRTNILDQYKNYVLDFVDQFSPEFDKIFYMREQGDKEAFEQKDAHIQLYRSRGKKFEEFKQGTDIADGAMLVEKIRIYCVTHPEERVLLYLGGHGWKNGSMKFNFGYDAEIGKELFDELTKIPNLILEIDSCITAEKLKGNNQQVEGVMANSEFDNANNSYDRCLFEAQSWTINMSNLQKKYPNLPTLLKEYRLTDNDSVGFLATHATDKTKGFLAGLDKYHTKFHNTTGYVSTLSAPIRTNTKQDIETTIRQLTYILSDYTVKNPTEKPLRIEFVNPENPKLPFSVPVEFLLSVLRETSYQYGDYNEDGKVSYGEARLYAMQYYKPFLPTVYRNKNNKTNHPYIKIS